MIKVAEEDLAFKAVSLNGAPANCAGELIDPPTQRCSQSGCSWIARFFLFVTEISVTLSITIGRRSYLSLELHGGGRCKSNSSKRKI